MGAYAALITKLQENRAVLVGEMKESLATAQKETRGLTKDEQAAWDAKDTEVRDLDASIERYRSQDEREERAAESRKETANAGREERGDASGARAVVTSEPTVYGRGSGHSYFLDMARRDMRTGAGDGGVNAAVDRMNRHAQEIDKVMP